MKNNYMRFVWAAGLLRRSCGVFLCIGLAASPSRGAGPSSAEATPEALRPVPSKAPHEARGPVPPPPAAAPAQPFISGPVLETMNADRYTYILVETGGKKVWVAGFTFPVKVGDTVAAPGGFAMRDFRSRSLNRTFDEIYFASPIEVMPAGHPAISLPPGHPGTAADAPAPVAEMDVAGIEPAPGGVTVAAVHERREQLAGTEVTVRGRVVKFTPAVMERNWIHLQDGSGQDEDRHDLTVTTKKGETAVGDIITVRGKVAVDRNLGFGYEYSVLVEDAVILAAPEE